MSRQHLLAIIGSGPSSIYLLKHILAISKDLTDNILSISLFEKTDFMGMGMPYSPAMVDKSNMANISSEEIPPLLTSFADWLKHLDDSTLLELNIERESINERSIFSRIALGRYLQSQYHGIIKELATAGVTVNEFVACPIVDICYNGPDEVTVITKNSQHSFNKVFIATGHYWPDNDLPNIGYFASPWPIAKLLPKRGEYLNYPIGTLGASLSAFDVIASLAAYHGEFVSESSGLEYRPAPGTERFMINMHSTHGRLPHLRYSLEKLQRKIYQRVSREDLLSLVDGHGYLRIDVFFNTICRPALREAFLKDGRDEIAELLNDKTLTFEAFIERMNSEHQYRDAFEGMRIEMFEARESVFGGKPIHWKEAIDDLIYTLNFHAELMPAEDHIFLMTKVMPFLLNVIAAMPLRSGEQLIALHDAGKLNIISGKTVLHEEQAGNGSVTVAVQQPKGSQNIDYQMFVDCTGQKSVEIEDYPFRSLVRDGVVRKARACFADARKAEVMQGIHKQQVVFEYGERIYYAGGIDIDGAYRVIGADGRPNNALFDLSFPHTSGVRPYSYGLQSCSDTGRIVAQALQLIFEDGEVKTELSETDVSTVYENV